MDQHQPDRTEKQREASRANGALSLGPNTPEGKAVSSQNALRHGLRAKALVLANESPELFEALIQDHLAEHQPATGGEHDLVVEMAYAKWRMYRIWTSEAASINKQMAAGRNDMDDNYSQFDESIRTAVAVEASLDRTRALDLYNRVEARCNRQYNRAFANLLAMKKARNVNERT